METIIKKIDQLATDEELAAIELAGKYIRAGQLVAFPTETVYGLGADALNEAAVAAIFAAKGRPADNPLIVHIADLEMLPSLVEANDIVYKLAAAFWPGPLTLVLPKKDIVPDIVTAGLDSVAVRMPDNRVALALIRASGRPIAAPSANLSGRPSPTVAEHVALDMAGRIPLILDGGATDIGLESTVIDIRGDRPTLLRPGKITADDLEPYLGKIAVAGSKEAKRPAAPGMKYTHYAPKAKVYLAKDSGQINQLIEQLQPQGQLMVIADDVTATALPKDTDVFIICHNNDWEAFARNIFAAFRLADAKGAVNVITETVPEQGIGLAIMNRLRKAGYKK